MGAEALKFNIGGANSAVGWHALKLNLAGWGNVAVGDASLNKNTAGIGNTSLGHNAMLSNDNGNYNTAAGYDVMTSNVSGSRNAAYGFSALSVNTTGSKNAGFGDLANVGSNNLTNATAIGANARVDASNSMVLGSVNGVNGATSGVHVGIGINAPIERLHVVQVENLNKNVIYGYAGQTSSSLDYANTGVTGFGQGNGIAGGFGYGFGVKGIGSSNSYGAIGVYAAISSSVPSPIPANSFYALYADVITPAEGKYAGVFLNGNVGIGTATPTQKLDVLGNILATGTITPSDERFKQNIQNIENPVEKLQQLNGVTYEYKAKEFPGRGFNEQEQVGVIAQDVEKVFPQLVFTGTDGYKAVDYPKLIPLLIEAMKEQQKQIDAQQKQNNVQQQQIDALKDALKKKK